MKAKLTWDLLDRWCEAICDWAERGRTNGGFILRATAALYLAAMRLETRRKEISSENGYQSGIQEGRNQVLYLLLVIGDENVQHDNWHPDVAQRLFELRQEILTRLSDQKHWPERYPDFETYSWRPG